MIKVFAVLFMSAALAFGQTSTITISDSSGNLTSGTINAGNVFFHDSNGNITFGTIRDGNIFLSTSKGEITFGTIKNGNVFLTDQKGNTTGTIQNGNIFLSNSNGSITTGNYNNLGSATTVTTSTSSGVSSGTITRPDTSASVQQSTGYQSGYVIGHQLGGAIASLVAKHHIRSFCKKQGDAANWRFDDGSIMPCASLNAGHPERRWPVQNSVSDPMYAMRLQEEGKQAYDLMEGLRHGMDRLVAYRDSPAVQKSMQESETSWHNMRNVYCNVKPEAVYTDLQGQQQKCP